jgi:hypothetical protein
MPNIIMYKILIFFLLSFVLISCKKSTDLASVKTIPTKKMIDAYTEVQYGNMPLVISVPHGGVLTPTSIPDRACQNITTATDIYTIEMLQAIDSVCKADYGIQPYYVYTNLRRIKIDQNRELLEATCSNASLAIYWNNYHYSLDTCLTKALAKYPQCLFIDLHGHGHTKQRLELGYLVSGNELRNPTTILPNNTSFFNLLNQNASLTVPQLLTGANAFGTLMANKNFAAVPSLQDAAPLVGDSYFDGGYNTSTYCNYAKVFGWQIENNYTGVRDNATSRTAFAKAFLQSLMEFYSRNTSMQPSTFGK